MADKKSKSIDSNDPASNSRAEAQTPLGKGVAGDRPSLSLAILSFVIPLVGAVLYLVQRRVRPRLAGSAGKGALLGCAAWVIVVLSPVAYVYFVYLMPRTSSIPVNTTVEKPAPAATALPADVQALFQAVQDNNLARAKGLLDKSPGLINSKNAEGETPLHWAATRGDKGIIALLVERGADVNARDASGVTPLQQAKDFDQKESVAIMLRGKKKPARELQH